MGTRKGRERQGDLWVAYTEMASGPGHPFYVRLNEVLDGEGFDAFVEKLCAKFFAWRMKDSLCSAAGQRPRCALSITRPEPG